MLKLRFLLWMLGRLLKSAWKKEPDFRQKLEQQPLRFVIKTSDGRLSRAFGLRSEGISVTPSDVATADMTLVFATPEQAWNTLTSKDRNAFMRAIQEGAVKVEGDYQRLFQLQGLMKFLKL